MICPANNILCREVDNATDGDRMLLPVCAVAVLRVIEWWDTNAPNAYGMLRERIK